MTPAEETLAKLKELTKHIEALRGERRELVEQLTLDKESQISEQLTLKDLDVSRRIVEYLQRQEIVTVSDLVKRSERDLVRLAISRSDINELKELLLKLELSLQEVQL